MVIRQLKDSEYDRLKSSLMEHGHLEPFSASYTVRMVVNKVEYRIKVQPERHHKMAILQALRVVRRADGPAYALITSGNLLSSLLELLIDQGAA